jgi:primosomal protein N' (replication factor Y)
MKVEIGTAVRVPLGGRRTGGHVVQLDERPPDRLRPLAAVSSPTPIFDQALFATLSWAAQHYVAPLSVLLAKAAPPNRPRVNDWSPVAEVGGVTGNEQLGRLGEESAARRARPPLAYMTRAAELGWIAALAGPVVKLGGGCLMVVPTTAEVEIAEASARPLLGDHLLAVSGDLADAEATRLWEKAAATPGVVLLGTPRVATWPVRNLRVAAVAEEGRRAMKERQTPTLHVRDLLLRRSLLAPHNLAFVGPTPSLEVLASRAAVEAEAGRAWGIIELVDRNRDDRSRDLISPNLAVALRRVVEGGRSAFVFAHRRGYAPALVCMRCGNLRRCPACGARPEPGEVCVRCGAALGPCGQCGFERFRPIGAGIQRLVEVLSRMFGEAAVQAAPAEVAIQVGSEADIAGLGPQDLAAVVDADGLLLGTHFRAAEEGLRILVRVAGKVRRGGGRRTIVQTALPTHPALIALREGSAIRFLRSELAVRQQLSFPPAAELIVIELRGDQPPAPAQDLAEIGGGAEVLGPAPTRDGVRFLIQGRDLDSLRLGLRSIVQRWRDSGTAVRIDVDPLEL